MFGDLQNNWIYPDANGPLHANSTFAGAGTSNASECPNTGMAPSCNPGAHQNSQDAKVGGYVEKNWFNGGGVPVVFPHIAIPQIGLRYKPIKQVVARLQAGFQITGFFFQLSVDYGLEKPPSDDDGGESTAPKKKKKAPDSDSGDSSGGGGDKN